MKTSRVLKVLLLILVTIIFSDASSLEGQNDKMSFKCIFLDKGLSQSSIFCIAKDRRDFMWFGTEDGLNRYDGYNFRVYKPNINDANKTLSDRVILCIYEDSNGILWIGTEKGLNKFDPENEKFTLYFKDQQITSICGSKGTYLWVGTNGGGLNRFDSDSSPEKEKFERFQHNKENINSLSNDSVTCILEDRSGLLWVGTKNGLNRFNLHEKKFERFQHQDGNVNSLSNNAVTCICEDESGILWIGTRKGLNRFDPYNTKSFSFKSEAIELDNRYIRSVIEYKSGGLLIGTQDDGLYKYDKKKNFFNYKYDPLIIDSISSNTIRSIYEDKSGLLWVGTFGGGINTFDPRMKPFEFHNDSTLVEVTAIYEDKQAILWIGSYNGVYNYHYEGKKKEWSFQDIDKDSKKLSSRSIYSIYEDRSNNIWVGTQRGLNKWDRKKRQFEDWKNICKNVNDYLKDRIYSISEDSKGYLWIGTSNNGMWKYDPERKLFTTHYDFKNKEVVNIYRDRNGILWIGTNGAGLYKFNHNNIVPYKENIIDNRVNTINEDSLENLWIGTCNGLYKIDKTGNIEAFQEKDGLSSGMIYGILPDSESNIWITTPRGISCFNVKKKIFKNFDADSDLARVEFYLGAYHKNKNGKMYFGCSKGFYAFFPNEIKDIIEPPIILTDFLIANNSVSPRWKDPKSPLNKMIYATDNIITLFPQQNFFSFEFAALNYTNPKRNSYEYRLLGWKGKDEGWIKTDSQNRRATFTNLAPGNYEFQVIGINADGVKSKMPASVKIRILPTFWQSLRFKVIVGIIVLALLGSAIGLGVMYKILNRQHEKLKNTQAQLVQKGRLANLGELAAGVAHEINNPSSFTIAGIYNLENSLKEFKSDFEELAGDEADSQIFSFFSEKFKVIFGQLATIREGTQRISNIVKKLRTFSRNDKNEMRKAKLLEGLQITLDLVKPNFKESVEFITDFQVDPEIICNPGDLNQVYLNLMINACEAVIEKQKEIGIIQKGTLTIRTSEEKEYILITFKDTGIGISQELCQKVYTPFFTTKAGGVGLGLAISYDIIKKHKGKIFCTSEFGKGTIFSVYLPKIKGIE